MRKPAMRNFCRSLAGWVGSLICCTLLAANASYAEGTTSLPYHSLVILGKAVETDINPIVQGGRMLVPIRVISERLGANVTYDGISKSVRIEHNPHVIQLQIGVQKTSVDGKDITLDTAPIIYRNRTMVPLRFVSQALQYEVEWDQSSGVAMISNRSAEPVLHTVSRGESLWTISNHYQVPVSVLKEENQLKTDLIKEGMTLVIPRESRMAVQAMAHSGNLYVVQPGDSLSVIAKNHATTVEAIQQQNGMIQPILHMGQVISLPPGASPSAQPLMKYMQDQSLASPRYKFPLGTNVMYEPIVDTFGDSRTWGASGGSRRSHEGIDLVAPKGTPVYSVSDGKVVQIGWNQYGGWRLAILDETGKYQYYYAHLSAYTPSVRLGTKVKAGQMIGFVGNTGYGPAGTQGKFISHLHFGMYQSAGGRPVNPFYYLKYWETNRMQG